MLWDPAPATARARNTSRNETECFETLTSGRSSSVPACFTLRLFRRRRRSRSGFLSVQQLVNRLWLHAFQLALEFAAILPIIWLGHAALRFSVVLAHELTELCSHLLFTTTHF